MKDCIVVCPCWSRQVYNPRGVVLGEENSTNLHMYKPFLNLSIMHLITNVHNNSNGFYADMHMDTCF